MELKRMEPPRTAEEASDLGHQWRLMQFVPGALRAFQWAYSARPSNESRDRLVELEQVNARIESRLHQLEKNLPQQLKTVKKSKQKTLPQTLNQLKAEANTALQLNPCHVLPWHILAIVAEREGQWGRAVLLWQEAQQRDVDGNFQVLFNERLAKARYQASKAGLLPLNSLQPQGFQAVPASVGYLF
jgi:hypothetical protein